MTVITVLKPVDFGSSIIKFILIVSYHASDTSSGQSLLRGRCCIGLVYKQRLQVL